jgi:hypothetical protein
MFGGLHFLPTTKYGCKSEIFQDRKRVLILTHGAFPPKPASPSSPKARFPRQPKSANSSVTQRGWTLDVLNIVRRLVESRRRGLPGRSIGAKTGDESLKSTGQPESLRLLTSSPTNEFTTADVYAFERELEKLHPDNRHVKDKIRQQLQVLRDTGLLLHIERGVWRLPL